MLRQELISLDELEDTRFSKLPVAVLSDEEFVWDEHEMAVFLRGSDGTSKLASG